VRDVLGVSRIVAAGGENAIDNILGQPGIGQRLARHLGVQLKRGFARRAEAVAPTDTDHRHISREAVHHIDPGCSLGPRPLALGPGQGVLLPEKAAVTGHLLIHACDVPAQDVGDHLGGLARFALGVQATPMRRNRRSASVRGCSCSAA
jgi:hypothetical protein